MATIKYPLQYPANSPRTPQHQVKHSRFSEKSVHSVIDDVVSELGRLRAREIIISSNFIISSNLDETRITDPGVAVYFTLFGTPRALACDKWSRVSDNLWAIYRHVEATRGLARWGVGSIEQVFAGYTALPFPTTSRSWFEILGVGQNATADEIQKAFRARAKVCHPDMGGANDEMTALNAAYDSAIKHLRAQKGGA